MKDYSEQTHDLLPKHESRILDGDRGERRSTVLTWKNSALLLIISLLSYIAFRVTFPTHAECACQQPAVPENSYVGILPNRVVELETRPEWKAPSSPFNQEPSEELDAVWADLLYALNIRITDEEMSLLGENKTNRVQVTGGNPDKENDYVGVLGVYHHMHCLNNIRRMIHYDYYESRMAGQKHLEGFSKEHSDHCINTIRQALMCHANLGVYTSEWDYETRNPSRSLESTSSTTCVRWDSLNNWARKRALVPGHYKYIRGPYDPEKPSA
ncbi:hypothetical protein O1611_g2126 [Lasiodiplodia mahajangana]|uniref:Uncharacterized protein n=1 Tax=Lasiodiplodia mahajangana TaxID=1108764 RepID=A0ACC2JVZ4_9PEZI|nr:hypothetical protein O1611_g2126 [Lasiodiplodia mahajangana]